MPVCSRRRLFWRLRDIEPGRLNTLITVQKQLVLANVHGQQEEQFVDAGTIWGSVEWLKGIERTEARRAGAVKPCRIRTRYRADLTENDRLVFRGETVNIEGIDDMDERNREFVIHGEARP